MHGEHREETNCRNLFLVFALGLFSFIWLCGPNVVWAQQKPYPSQTIKIVVPNAPGGSTDLAARIVADYLGKDLKVPVIIENREGGSGLIGATAVLKAKPDGYTMLAGGDTSLTAGILQSPNPPYDPFKDFSPICMLGSSVAAYGVYSSSPFNTLGDFVKAAKQSPGKLSCGVTNIGSSTHLHLELLKKYSGMDINVVPYKGVPDAIAALLGKHIDMLVLIYVGFLPYVKSGEAKILVVSDSVPNTTLQTLQEAGFPQPGFRATDAFLGFHVSSNTPKPIYEKLVLAFERIAKIPEFAVKLNNIGLIRKYKNPAELKEFMKEKWLVYSEGLEQLGLKKWQGKID